MHSEDKKLFERLPEDSFDPSSGGNLSWKKALFRDPCTAMRQNSELEASAPTDPGLQFLLFGFFLLSIDRGSRREGAPL
jgi:hypothetical protein